jgi:predicted dehydrogenase
MEDKVRIGIIGSGGIARAAHLPGYQAVEAADVVAVCDVMPGRAEAFAKEHDIPNAYSNYEEMLEKEDLDGVSVCTPNYAHKDAAIAALEAGAHVLCEKPMAMNLTEAREMAAAAEEAGKILQIGLNWRFTSEAQTLRRYVEAGDFGEIYYGEATVLRRRGIPSWGVFTQKSLQGGGALIDVGVHALDLTMWLMGNPKPVSVTGVTYQAFGKRDDVVNPWGPWDTSLFDVDDMGIGLIRFDNGASLVLRASWAANLEASHGNRVLGTHGGAQTMPIKVFTEQHGALVDVTPTSLPEVRAHTEEIRHFIACIQGEQQPIVKVQQVLDVQAVLDAVYASAESGHEVVIEN